MYVPLWLGELLSSTCRAGEHMVFWHHHHSFATSQNGGVEADNPGLNSSQLPFSQCLHHICLYSQSVCSSSHSPAFSFQVSCTLPSPLNPSHLFLMQSKCPFSPAEASCGSCAGMQTWARKQCLQQQLSFLPWVLSRCVVGFCI